MEFELEVGLLYRDPNDKLWLASSEQGALSFDENGNPEKGFFTEDEIGDFRFTRLTVEEFRLEWNIELTQLDRAWREQLGPYSDFRNLDVAPRTRRIGTITSITDMSKEFYLMRLHKVGT